MRLKDIGEDKISMLEDSGIIVIADGQPISEFKLHLKTRQSKLSAENIMDLLGSMPVDKLVDSRGNAVVYLKTDDGENVSYEDVHELKILTADLLDDKFIIELKLLSGLFWNKAEVCTASSLELEGPGSYKEYADTHFSTLANAFYPEATFRADFLNLCLKLSGACKQLDASKLSFFKFFSCEDDWEESNEDARKMPKTALVNTEDLKFMQKIKCLGTKQAINVIEIWIPEDIKKRMAELGKQFAEIIPRI